MRVCRCWTQSSPKTAKLLSPWMWEIEGSGRARHVSRNLIAQKEGQLKLKRCRTVCRGNEWVELNDCCHGKYCTGILSSFGSSSTSAPSFQRHISNSPYYNELSTPLPLALSFSFFIACVHIIFHKYHSFARGWSFTLLGSRYYS